MIFWVKVFFDPGRFEYFVKILNWSSLGLWTVHSPLFFREFVDVDRWVRTAAILVSWCERNWGEYKMPVGRGGGVNSMGVRGHFVLSPVSLASRDQDGGHSNSKIDINELMEKKGTVNSLLGLCLNSRQSSQSTWFCPLCCSIKNGRKICSILSTRWSVGNGDRM